MGTYANTVNYSAQHDRTPGSLATRRGREMTGRGKSEEGRPLGRTGAAGRRRRKRDVVKGASQQPSTRPLFSRLTEQVLSLVLERYKPTKERER